MNTTLLLIRTSSCQWVDHRESINLSVSCFRFKADGQHHLSEEIDVPSPRFLKMDPQFFRVKNRIAQALARRSVGLFRLECREEQPLRPHKSARRVWSIEWEDPNLDQRFSLHSHSRHFPTSSFRRLWDELSQCVHEKRVSKIEAPVFVDSDHLAFFPSGWRKRLQAVTIGDRHVEDGFALVMALPNGSMLLKQGQAFYIARGPDLPTERVDRQGQMIKRGMFELEI